MGESTGHGALRQLIGDAISNLGDVHTHATLNDALAELAMPPAPDEAGSKRERVQHSFTRTPDGQLHRVAERLLANGQVAAATRTRLEDLLWAEASPPQIPKRTRRELARSVSLAELCRSEARFIALLDRFWELGADITGMEWFFPPSAQSLRNQIQQHVLRNSDWSVEELFDHLGAFEAGDGRFARFLEAAVSADVLLDEPSQRLLVEAFNKHLRDAAIELRETSTDGGYPCFTMVSTRLAGNRRPKNIIFATLTKPDIRFQSAVDNDIEIVSGEVLVYDRPTTTEGLRWRDLQSWWRDRQHITSNDEAKKSLYNRLRRSLPHNSRGQQNLFDLYHRILADAVQDLPALLPEVWLHWDPKTVSQRGPEALLRSRMDFLLLLPHGQRIVLEVDGSQHYSRDGGQRPDSAKYAAMMAGDRDLRLRGYEVFRFGHDELKDPAEAQALLKEFLPAMFRRFDMSGSIG